MMHNINELYKINGQKFYTEEYIIVNNIPKCACIGDKQGWSKAHYSGANSKDYINIIDVDGVKKGYTYGEKAWFDTKEERDAHRVTMTKAREEQAKKNKLIKSIMAYYESMTIEQLNEVVATM